MEHGVTFPEFLKDILASESKHYLWLRLLSYLEYIGYRKMVKAIPYAEVNKGVFYHLRDEIQHSFMLRELAGKSFHRPSLKEEAFEDLVKIGEAYFQTLDSKIHDWVAEKGKGEQAYICYLLVSYLVEKRVMMVYPQYFNHLRSPSLKIVIRKIIQDEAQHLDYLEGVLKHLDPVYALRGSPLPGFEEEIFGAFLHQMQYFLSRWAEGPVLTAQKRAARRVS